MLAENLNVLGPSADDGAGLPADEGRQEPRPLLRREPPPAYRALADSYAAELLRKSRAGRIDWEFVRHYQPSPADVLAGRSLTDETFYETLARGSLDRTADEELP